MAIYRTFYISGPGSGWKDKLRLFAGAAVGVAILIAAIILSLSLALILIPIGLVAYLFRRQILKSLLGASVRRQPQAAPGEREAAREAGGVTIETDYRIVEPRQDRR